MRIKSKRKTYLHWYKQKDNPYRYTMRVIKTLYVMWPRIVYFGFRYVWDVKFRESCRKKLNYERMKVMYGSGYLSNKRSIMVRLKLRDGMGCHICHIVNRQLTIDHIVPVFKGGSSELPNLQILCVNCHRQKSNKEVLEANKVMPRQARVKFIKPKLHETAI